MRHWFTSGLQHHALIGNTLSHRGCVTRAAQAFEDEIHLILTYCLILFNGLSCAPPPSVFQVLFRSANKLLMDTATSEYLFCADFFSESAIFHELFAATLAAVGAHLASSVQVTPGPRLGGGLW